MKNKKIIIGLAMISALSFLVTGCGKKAELKDGAEVAVSLKGTKITATKYYEEIKEKNITTLIDLIDNSILNKDYPTDDDEKKEVENQLSQMKKNYAENDDEKFQTIIKQYFGVETVDELKEMLSLEYKRNKAVKDYISDNLTDKEIEKYYKNNVNGKIKASHILITVDTTSESSEEEKEKAEQKALKEAKKIIKYLNEGKDFAELAKKYSDEEGTAINGGDLGYFDPNEMVEEFATAVKNLKNKEYTKEPVKTKYGYHIIYKVDEKEKEKLDDVKDEIKEKLTTEKLDNDSTIYYESLIKYREKKKIKWNDSALEKAYNDYMDKLISNATQN